MNMENAIFGFSQVHSLGCLELFSVISRTISSSAQSWEFNLYEIWAQKEYSAKTFPCEQQKNFPFYIIFHYCQNVKTKEKKTI